MSTIKKSQRDYDGEPGCHTPSEINNLYRHYYDPTTYWECGEQGKAALKRRCPQTQLFSEKVKKCVHYTEWQWTEPKEPPSRPKN